MTPAQVWKLTTPAERLCTIVVPLVALAGCVSLAITEDSTMGQVFMWGAALGMVALLVADLRSLRVLARRRVRPRPILPLDPARETTVDVMCHAALRPHRWRWVPGQGWHEIDHPDGKCAHQGEPV